MALTEILQEKMVRGILCTNKQLVTIHFDVLATYFGKGVYFAVKASYSAENKYSRPETNGNKHMFLARVLTGEYAKGDEDMKTPPPKDPKNPLKLYDSVVNDTSSPVLFVIFYDAQCYPEYIITFK